MLAQQSRNISSATGSFSADLSKAGSASILIVDDDAGMRTALLKILRANGLRCFAVADGMAMRDVLDRHPIDLILLDVMMPGANGFDLCRDLRMRDGNTVPIIMISARGGEADLVTGLELGADDYIAKPFGRSELLARIRAALRRSGSVAAQPARQAQRLGFSGWWVDLRQRALFSPSGACVDLSGAEYDLLVTLLENAQRVIARETLLEMSRARMGHASDRTVDVHICRLRRKLGDAENRQLIRTVRGMGYIFTQPVEPL